MKTALFDPSSVRSACRACLSEITAERMSMLDEAAKNQKSIMVPGIDHQLSIYPGAMAAATHRDDEEKRVKLILHYLEDLRNNHVGSNLDREAVFLSVSDYEPLAGYFSRPENSDW